MTAPVRPPAPSRPPAPAMHGLLPALQSLLYVLVVVLFAMTFTVQPIRIPSPSMEPTLLVGDFLLLDRQSAAHDPAGLLPPTGVARGEIVVFHDPVDERAVHLVKRVVGVPGDRLHLHHGVLVVNGSAVPEPYLAPRPAPGGGELFNSFRDDFPSLRTAEPAVDPAWWIALRHDVHDGELTVPPGEYFVLGDNRTDSQDSRYWGFVPREAIVGRPVLVYFSWDRKEDRKEDRKGDGSGDGKGDGKALGSTRGGGGSLGGDLVQALTGRTHPWSSRPAAGNGGAPRWERIFHVVR